MTPRPRMPLRERLSEWAYVVVGTAAVAVGTAVGLAVSLGEFIASGMEPKKVSTPASRHESSNPDTD